MPMPESHPEPEAKTEPPIESQAQAPAPPPQVFTGDFAPPPSPAPIQNSFGPTPMQRPSSLNTPPGQTDYIAPPSELLSQPVVKVLSPRGIEYVFLTIALFTAAISLGAAVISVINGQTGFNVLSVPVASLIVSIPVFALLFLRLKNTELKDPTLKYEASKRRSTQFTQIVGFLVCFFTLIGFLATIFAKMAGQYSGSIFKVLLDVLVVLVIAGGILAYYWRDEHRLEK